MVRNACILCVNCKKHGLFLQATKDKVNISELYFVHTDFAHPPLPADSNLNWYIFSLLVSCAAKGYGKKEQVFFYLRLQPQTVTLYGICSGKRKTKLDKKLKKERYSLQQEVVHSMIHAFGILFGIISIPILTVLASKNENISGITGAGIYGFSFLMLFSFSTLYHGVQQPQVKKVLEVLDHISIYFLIAGTYTPFLLIYLRNAFGISLLCVLWGLTLLGIVFKIFFTGRFNFASVIIYLLMGWIFFVGGKRFFTAIPSDVLVMIIIGGGLYSIGIIFYLWKGYGWHHAVWHFFVLAAAVCHYVAVLLAV
jgi:hemolysin III